MKEKSYEPLRVVDYPLMVAGFPVKRRFFLQGKLHFYLILAVITTTLFSWFNVNSYLVILLLVCRLLDGNPVSILKTAFTNKYFLAYCSIFLLELIGLFYTHHLFTGWKQMESKATLAAIPFLLCSGPFTDNAGYRQLLSAYCLLLAGVCLYCLSIAFVKYHWQHDTGVFFYHELTSPVGVNAVFFSAYVIVALLFLLFSSPSPTATIVVRRLRIGLILFFTAMMVLLSSKLLLVLLVFIFYCYLAGHLRFRLMRGQFIVLGLLTVLGAGTLALTDNPISRRYKEILPDDTPSIGSPARPHPRFNGVSLRLLMWQYACEILNDRKAWLYGVSAGDSQNLLDQKYLAAGMSQGYLKYNFHNEYVEVLVRSGIIGLCIMLVYTGLLIGLVRSAATLDAAFTVALVLLLFLTESILEMQHTLFLSSFFPLLTGNRYKGMRKSPP